MRCTPIRCASHVPLCCTSFLICAYVKRSGTPTHSALSHSALYRFALSHLALSPLALAIARTRSCVEDPVKLEVEDAPARVGHGDALPWWPVRICNRTRQAKAACSAHRARTRQPTPAPAAINLRQSRRTPRPRTGPTAPESIGSILNDASPFVSVAIGSFGTAGRSRHITAQHCTALHITARHCTSLHSIARHCTAFARDCTAFARHCTSFKLHSIAHAAGQRPGSTSVHIAHSTTRPQSEVAAVLQAEQTPPTQTHEVQVPLQMWQG